jgi:PEP-CTERM motif
VNLRNILLASTAIAAFAAVAVPAHAGSIVTNQWYGATFGSAVNSPLAGNQQTTATNGPLLAGTGSSVTAPASPWTINLPNGGFLTITDVEASGDAFTMSDNGSTLGTTATPTDLDTSCDDNIGCALGDSNYSSGTFILPAGTNSISGFLSTYSGTGGGDTYFIIQENTGTPIPEPASLAVLSVGMAGLAAVRRRRKR